MKRFLVLAFLTSQITYGQIVNIPDSIFKGYVLSKCDTNNDGNVQMNEAILIDSLVIESMGISDLTGMEYFSNLSWIQCGGNNISTMNTSNNPNLKFIHCNGNQINSIDVSNNPLLFYLECRDNDLTALDFRNRSTGSLPYLDTRSNENLLCVSVDDPAYAYSSLYFFRDSTTLYSTNCSVSIEENSFSNVSVYPNPTKGFIHVDLGVLQKNVTARMTNSVGEVIFTVNSKSTDFFHFDLDIPTGIYFLQIENSEGVTRTIKVLKK
jgi:hypothetical protein